MSNNTIYYVSVYFRSSESKTPWNMQSIFLVVPVAFRSLLRYGANASSSSCVTPHSTSLRPLMNEFLVSLVTGINAFNMSYQNLSNTQVEFAFPSTCQGRAMMSLEDLKAWPQKKWMSRQKTLPLHQWLSKHHVQDHKERLKACGNIVVPAMAYFGMNCLFSMWRWVTYDHVCWS